MAAFIFYYIIGSVFLLISGYFLFRVLVRNDYLKKGRLSYFTSFLELLFFALHANFFYVFIPVKWPNLPSLAENQFQYFSSLFWMTTGLAILLLSLLPLGFFRVMGLKSHRLKTTGLYKYSRNPQVIGYFLILIGFSISYPSLYSLGWLIVFSIVVHRMVLTEEEYLEKKYKDIYSDYRLKVPRYVGIKR
jgi:protein-S-isoprenylcysteine O-methyltransferase Ste14